MAYKTTEDKTVEERLQEMFSLVDPRLIITFDSRMQAVYIGGVKAEEAQVLALKAEAEFILNSDLWKIIHETPKELAMRAMFVDGKTLDDMQKGRSIIYTLDTQKKILETLASAKKVK